ncbi:N-acyl homoserine lactonase family protein [Nocardioides mangrovi]|uniref:N-acyl homoserine lactonase family protein n=1 Tax=Nocardioides mangrovi TaxID=2874580 RepID=A0ABS7UEV0_9ACTN|nr:N-acyl homoserine lactonase family protein [Nocardioides mangrovi]MBZ5739379.1 N-acyl homoserine lactonase family protein [Nocardioides mangrovi]
MSRFVSALARPRPVDGPVADLDGMPLRMHPLVLGWEPIPESLSLHGGSASTFLLEPVTAAVVVYADGWVLLDSGFDVDALADPAIRRARFVHGSYNPVVPPGDPLLEQVAALGLSWRDLRAVGISHVHFDHTGGLRLVAPGIPVLLQRAEWEYAATGAVVAANPSEFRRSGLDVVLAEGDTELAPGLWALDTAGHTPGHQSFAVSLPGQRIVLACDAADLHVNVTGPTRCGSTERPEDAAAAQRAIERLAELDAAEGTTVWPAHDPDWPGWREHTVA